MRVRNARSAEDARSDLYVLRVAVDPKHADRLREAAERCHCCYEDSVVSSLDAAAAALAADSH